MDVHTIFGLGWAFMLASLGVLILVCAFCLFMDFMRPYWGKR